MKNKTYQIRFSDTLVTVTPKKVLEVGDFTYILHRPYNQRLEKFVEGGWQVSEVSTGLAVVVEASTMKSALAKLDDITCQPGKVREAVDYFFSTHKDIKPDNGMVNTVDIVNDLTKSVKDEDFNHVMMVWHMVDNTLHNTNDQLGALESIKGNYPELCRYLYLLMMGNTRIKSNYKFNN